MPFYNIFIAFFTISSPEIEFYYLSTTETSNYLEKILKLAINRVSEETSMYITLLVPI